MCGIAGKLSASREAPISVELLRRMADSLAHRGPDGEGFYRAPGIGLAHRRLAIFDPEGGAQPMANEDGSIRVVFNGAIYNHLELRAELEAAGHRFGTRSDTEVLVHLWEEKGEELVGNLRGMFAFALWDERRRLLFCARDRLGKKPLYYAHLPGGDLVFGSEPAAVLCEPTVDRSLSLEALDAYLRLLYVPAPLSAFAGLRQLRPGHLLLADAQGLRVREYWHPEATPEDQGESPEELRDALASELREAVGIRLRADVPVGAFLSGGLDSAAVVTEMAELRDQAPITATLGFEDPEQDERPAARRLARHLGCQSVEGIGAPPSEQLLREIVRAYGEPFGDSSALPTYQLCELARREAKVMLAGDGGDELFAGYWFHRTLRTERRLRGWLGSGGRRLLAYLTPRVPGLDRPGVRRLGLDEAAGYAALHCGFYLDEGLRGRLLRPEVFRSLEAFDPAAPLRKRYQESPMRDPLGRALWVDLTSYLPDDLLVKVDRASMAHGLEVRSPFLDPEVVKLALRIPSSFKLRGGRGKWILRQALRGRVPSEVLRRQKHGFTIPVAAWLRGSLRALGEGTLLGDGTGLATWCDLGTLRRLWSEHLSGRLDRGPLLWALLIFELWRQECLEGGPR